MNWFIFGCGALQLLGAIQYWCTGKLWFGVLYLLYALTNFVILIMARAS